MHKSAVFRQKYFALFYGGKSVFLLVELREDNDACKRLV